MKITVSEDMHVSTVRYKLRCPNRGRVDFCEGYFFPLGNRLAGQYCPYCNRHKQFSTN